MALKFHPDKNKDADAVERFQEIYSAYEFLSEKGAHMESKSYADILNEFMKNQSPFIGLLLRLCGTRVKALLDTLDNDMLNDIATLIVVNKDMFPEAVVKEIQQLVLQRRKTGERIILNPSLDDLMSDNLYKLVIDERVYMIPLWQKELIYDVSGADMFVICKPVLPDNLYIDANNNITVSLQRTITELLSDEQLRFSLGQKQFEINASCFTIAKTQEYCLHNAGISRMATKDVYDTKKRGNIIVLLTLT